MQKIIINLVIICFLIFYVCFFGYYYFIKYDKNLIKDQLRTLIEQQLFLYQVPFSINNIYIYII